MPEFLYAYGEDGKRFPEATIGQSFNDHFYNRVGFCGCGPYRFARYERGPAHPARALRGLVRRPRRHPLPDQGPRACSSSPTRRRTSSRSRRARSTSGASRSPQWKEVDPRQQGPEEPVQRRPDRALDGKSARLPLLRLEEHATRSSRTSACARRSRSPATASRSADDIFLDRYRPMSSPIYPESSAGRPDAEAPALRPEGRGRAARRGGLEAERRHGPAREGDRRARRRPSSSRSSGPGRRPTSRRRSTSTRTTCSRSASG